MSGATVAAFLILLSAGVGLCRAEQVAQPALDGVESRVRAKIEGLRRQVATRPASADRWGRYGMALDAHDFSEAGQVAYRRAHALDPTEFRWPYYLATGLDLSEPREAVEWFERAIALDASYAPARVRYGEALERLGRTAEAHREFLEARRLDPKNPFGEFGLGRVALGEGRLGEAVRHLESAYAINPEIKALVATLSQAYFRSGRVELARQRASEAKPLPRVTYRPDQLRADIANQAVDFRSYLRRASTYLTVGHLVDAEVEIRTALELQPELAEAHYIAAEIFDARGDAFLAVEEARIALQLAPRMEDLRPILAGNLLKLRQFDEAAGEAHQVLETHAKDVRMLLVMAMISMERSDIGELTGFLDRAYRAGTGNPSMRNLMRVLLSDLATSFAEGGFFEEAIARSEQVLDLTRQAGATRDEIASAERRLALYRAGRFE